MSAPRNTALEPGVWPAHAALRPSGELAVDGLGATELAERFGTPLYVLDEGEIRDRARHFVQVFSAAAERIGTTSTVYYAAKALLTAEVARWMGESGLHIDVASGGELAISLAGGVPAAELGVHGNNKSVAEIERAIRVGVGSLVIDSVQEIERVAHAAARAGVVQAVRLRVNSGVHAHTHEFLATAHDDQKFGVSMADAPGIVANIRSHASLRFLGVHCHIGSQIFDAGGFAESARRLLSLHRILLAGGPVPELNLGGGFGIAYTADDAPMPIERIAELIVDTVQSSCDELDIPVPGLVFEPGRWIVGNAGLTLYEVGTVKPVQLENGSERVYVAVDGGMSDNARPSLYGAEYTARIVNRSSTEASVPSRVAGKHCESGDILVSDAQLPSDTHAGDILAIAATGAYCYSLSSNYNALLRPAMVAVRDGVARIIVRRETERDLLSRDLGVQENQQ